MLKLFAAVAAGLFAIAGVAAASATREGPLPGSLEPAQIATLDLSATVEAMQADKSALLYYLSEMHRRFPSEVEAPDMAGLPPIDADSAKLLAAASDDALLHTIERVSAEVESLVAHGNTFAAGSAPMSPAPKVTAPAATEKPYCDRMYGQAYMLCASDDRSCKMFAANDLAICRKTGRWP